MYFSRNLVAITALGALLATSVASPAPAPAPVANASSFEDALTTREELANVAVVNVYSSTTCGAGGGSSFTVTGSSLCQAVSNANSIAVSEHDCATYTWSGTNCEGTSKNISGGACVTVSFGSVHVAC